MLKLSTSILASYDSSRRPWSGVERRIREPCVLRQVDLRGLSLQGLGGLPSS
jgi:hypothetical protein